jgi:hypothetical protein
LKSMVSPANAELLSDLVKSVYVWGMPNASYIIWRSRVRDSPEAQIPLVAEVNLADSIEPANSDVSRGQIVIVVVTVLVAMLVGDVVAEWVSLIGAPSGTPLLPLPLLPASYTRCPSS